MRKAFNYMVLAGIMLAPLCVGDFAAAGENEPEKVQSKIAEQEAKRQKELENTEWQVMLYSADIKNKNQETGTLVFQNNTLSFKGFKKFDIGTIGYTLTAYEESEKGTWETYKITKDGNISIRGDWEAQVMNGIISEQLDGEKTVKISRFTSVNQVKPILVDTGSAESGAKDTPQESSYKALVSTETEQKI